MRRKLNTGLLNTAIIGVIALALFACKKENKYSDIPEIISAEIVPINNTIDVVMVFTDGNGDFGIDESQDLPEFRDSIINEAGEKVHNLYYYNVFMDIEIKNAGNWEVLELPGFANVRATDITPKGQNKQIKATYTYHIPAGDYEDFVDLEVNEGDTMRVSLQIVDRALNHSNLAITNEHIYP